MQPPTQPPLQPPPGPQQPPSHFVTRRYFQDAHYSADAANMAAAGWRVTDLRRMPDNTIIATYTYGAAPPTVPLTLRSGLTAPVIPPVTPSPPPVRWASLVDAVRDDHEPPVQRSRQYFPFANTPRQALINRIALGVAAGLVLVLFIVCAVSGSISSAADASATATAGTCLNGASATASSAEATLAAFDATQAAQPTVTPLPTAPSAPSAPLPTATSALSAPLPTRAVLGGLVSDFDARYGAEIIMYIWDTTLDGYSVQFRVHSPGDSTWLNSSDGKERVWTVSLIYNDSPPSASTQLAQARQFFPSDTRLIKINCSASPVELIYRSALLANAFQADAFQNYGFQDVTPGTFDYIPDSNGTGWSIQTGQE